MSDQSQGMTVETGMFTLADLANLSTDEATVLMSRLPDTGIFVVRGVEVRAGITDPVPDQPQMFFFNFQAEILEADPLDKNKDRDSYVGKTLRERYTLWPNDFKTMLGLLQGRFKIVGLPFTGPVGGVEGSPPGWIDSWVGHIHRVRVRHWTGKNGNQNAAFDWLALKEDKREEVAA